jgi:hypothetical protein
MVSAKVTGEDVPGIGAANVATGTVAHGITGYREKTLILPEAGYLDGISLTLDIPSTT